MYMYLLIYLFTYILHGATQAPTEERPLGARRDRESSPAANARLASPLRVMGGSGSGWQLAQWPREAPSRLRPSSRTSPHRRDRASRAGAPAPGSPQNQDAAGRSPLKQERLLIILYACMHACMYVMYVCNVCMYVGR